jgi:hypothetical protein
LLTNTTSYESPSKPSIQPLEQAAVAHLDQVQLVQRAAAAVQKLVTAKNHQKADLIHHS